MQNMPRIFQKRDVLMDISNYLRSIDSIKKSRHFQICWKKNKLKKKSGSSCRSIEDIMQNESQHSLIKIANKKLKQQREKQRKLFPKLTFPRLRQREISRSQKLINHSQQKSNKPSSNQKNKNFIKKPQMPAKSIQESKIFPELENITKEQILKKYKNRLRKQLATFSLEIPISYRENVKNVMIKFHQVYQDNRIPEFGLKWLRKDK